MNMEDAALKIEGHEHEIKSLKHRMADVERDQQALLKLTASVEVMATKQEEMGTKVSRIDEKMTEMEGKSAKRWDSLVDKVIWLIAGACIAALFASAGITI